MKPLTKTYLFILLFFAFYYLCFFEIFLHIFPDCPIDLLFNYSQNDTINFILMMVFCLSGAFILTALIGFFSAKLQKRKKRLFPPKIGEVMVSRGYITDEELKEALSEQCLRIGEVLVTGGFITTAQLDHALLFQKKSNMKTGEILIDLGYSTEENIQWALEKQDRKLGEIFVEKGFFTKDEIDQLLDRKRYGQARNY